MSDDPYDVLAERDGALARLVDAHGRPDPFIWDFLENAAGHGAFAELALHRIRRPDLFPAAVPL